MDSSFNAAVHDSYIKCSKCKSKNAPKNSRQYTDKCYSCGNPLEGHDYERGDTVVVSVEDIHESGAGVGKTTEGFVVLVDGILPDATARVELTRVYDTSAQGELIEEVPKSEFGETEEDKEDNADEEDEDDQRLGSRENYWGR